MKRLPCALALAGTLVGAATLVSGCSTMSPMQTTVSYNPGDGVPASSGPVQARNLLIVAEAKDGPGRLSGYLVNRADTPVQVSFQTREEAESNAPGTSGITLAGREQRTLKDITFAHVDAAPGGLTDIYLVTPTDKSMVAVPVLAPQGDYATLRPTQAATASPTTAPTTATATSGRTATQTATQTATPATTSASPTTPAP